MNNKHTDVVIDITLDDQFKAVLLLETLLVLNEGVECRYWIQLGQRRLIPELQELIIKFQAEKSAQITYDLPKLEFPQELIDREFEEANPNKHRIPIGTKRSWFVRNLILFKYFFELDEFYYLVPDTVILYKNWLQKLAFYYDKHVLPVHGYVRKIERGENLIRCGWSSMGWYNGRRLRRLPLMRMFQERMANPWKGMSTPGQPWQPGYCLTQDWLSAFDMPLGYVLFALYFKEKTGNKDPLYWDLASRESMYDVVKSTRSDVHTNHPIDFHDSSFIILHEIGLPIIAKRKLREHYISQARQFTHNFHQDKLNGIYNLSLSGPKYNLIGDNRRKLTLDDLHNMFIGERCFIIGNGPSLNKTNLNILKAEYTIGLNRIYLNFEKMGFQTTFLCATNPNVLKQFGKDIDQINSVKFLRYHNKYIRNRWNTFFMEHTGFHVFIKDLRDFKWCEGCTVTFCAMQVAYFLGFETIILIGVDHNFPNSGKPHQLVTSNSLDTNHFHPNYFGYGVKWQYPDLAGSEVSYRVADVEFKRDGRTILDATVDGRLEVFKKCDLESLF